MKLRNLGDGRYQLIPSGWTVERDDPDSTFIWTVYDALGKERLHRTTRKEAVEGAVRLLDALIEDDNYRNHRSRGTIMSAFNNGSSISIPGCGDAYILTYLDPPVARLIISEGTDINLGVDEWGDDPQEYPISIEFGESGQMSVSLVPNDVVILVEQLREALEHRHEGIRR